MTELGQEQHYESRVVKHGRRVFATTLGKLTGWKDVAGFSADTLAALLFFAGLIIGAIKLIDTRIENYVHDKVDVLTKKMEVTNDVSVALNSNNNEDYGYAADCYLLFNN